MMLLINSKSSLIVNTLPDSVGSFPLVIYIHGGGYIPVHRYCIVKCRTNAGHQILSRKWIRLCQHRIPSNQ